MDRLNGWLSLIANIGVIAGVLFVGFEIQQNTDQMQAEVAQGIMSSLREQSNPVRESIEISEMYYNVVFGGQKPSDPERYQVTRILPGYFRVYEEAYLHHQQGRLEDAYWNALAEQFGLALSMPVIIQYWEEESSVGGFNPNFVIFGNSLIQ
ncbi:MAG: hypothetical protein GKR90_22655 [Pseudomonadales bacterium]|nr:hypothetical protein [Pseudomonadales bacterium]